MVKKCHQCGIKSFGRCGNGCPKILRLQSPKEKDFRLICFKCFQSVAEEKHEQFQQHYLGLNKRLQQMREQLDAVYAASAPREKEHSEEPEEHAAASSSTKKARHSKEPEKYAAAASSAKKAKHSEEPHGVLPWSDKPPPAKKRRQESAHQEPNSKH